MRQAEIYLNSIMAGKLTETDNGKYIFEYDSIYCSNPKNPSISLTLPKSQRRYESYTLFPFFANMLSEGSNKALQCRTMKIDENDEFGLLLATAYADTIGAVTVKRIK